MIDKWVLAFNVAVTNSPDYFVHFNIITEVSDSDEFWKHTRDN
jgi:hypothetical protein